MYFVRCAAHGVDLAFEDVFKLDYFKEAANEMRQLISYIKNHHATAAAWKQLQGTKALLLPATTRFATNFIMLQRASEMSGKLQQLAVSDAWDAFVDSLSGRDAKEAAASAKRTALDSRLFTKISMVRGMCGTFLAACLLHSTLAAFSPPPCCMLHFTYVAAAAASCHLPACMTLHPTPKHHPRLWPRSSQCTVFCGSWTATRR